MNRTRRKFSNEFKAKVAIEALKERHTLSELAKTFEIHPNQISQWKREFMKNADKAFGSSGKEQDGSEKDQEKLYSKIGKLEVENDFLKKSLWKTGL